MATQNEIEEHARRDTLQVVILLLAAEFGRLGEQIGEWLLTEMQKGNENDQQPT